MLLFWLISVVGILAGLQPAAEAKHPLLRRPKKFDRWNLDETQPLQDGSAQELRYRLPRYIVPTHYDLAIESRVHTGNRAYNGSVDIHVEVRQQTSTIYVHNRGLRITANELYLAESNANVTFLETLRYVTDAEREFSIFSIRRALIPGQYILHLDFEGDMRVDEDGFYLSSYRDVNGDRRYLGATQFQAISARSAFPCLDEPGLKATVALQIKHHPSYQAVSNMPVWAIAGDSDGYVVTVFETTPRMSIYLLAFLVSDFAYTENMDANQRVFARPTALDQMEFALEAGVRIMAVLDEYLGLPFNSYLPKVDQVALPDFSAGAMENWGLCKYREEYLLYEPGVTSYRTETFITTIVAHEYAHQWFGNLVTAEWWSYLWLNEGFATLYEYLAADLAYPERRYRDLFNVDVLQRVLVSDASENTRPMTFSRGATFDTIVSLFDNVAYSKGGSVLQMFRHLLTEPVWQQVLRVYLESNEFGAVTTDHFIDAMVQVTDSMDLLPDTVELDDFIKSWVDQAGYPVLDVRRTYRGDIVLSQDRFYSNKIVTDDTALWMIPYTMLEEGDSPTDSLEWNWLTSRAIGVPTEVANDRWILANVNQTGFYRVNYDITNWNLLIDALLEDPTNVPLHSRAQLVDDAFHLARSNRLDLEISLELLTYLRNERDYPPWQAASRVFNYFDSRMRGTPDYVLYQLFIDTLIGDLFLTLDITSVAPDEPLLDKYLKQLITSWACRTLIESCLTDTRVALEREVAGDEPVHPDVATVVYCYGLRTASPDAFAYLFGKLQASQNLGERSLLIDALGCSTNDEQLNDYLLTAIGGELQVNYDSEERYYVLTSVLATREGTDALVRFLIENYTYVVEILGQGALNSLVQNIASATNTPAEEEMLNMLLQELEPSLSAAVIANAQATVRRNLAWPSTREGVLVNLFVQRYDPVPV
ncbi:aminopeptidase N-like [Anopheles nili]|uniref:aminopeptidase N-like n=1 Tax=Anopheles nili TaxID=185578 RepID=UPI00237A104B|nr:aminopeptidase N-like [Anopheles nili]